MKGERKQVYVRVTINLQYRAVKSKRSRWAPATGDGEAAISECFHFRLPATGIPLACVTLHLLQAGAKCSRGDCFETNINLPYIIERKKQLMNNRFLVFQIRS